MVSKPPNLRAFSYTGWEGAREIAIEASPAASGSLFFSDNPETLRPGTIPEGQEGLVLWGHEVTESAVIKHLVRAFLWHENQSGRGLFLGLTLQNLAVEAGNGLSATALRARDLRSGDYFKAGQRIARDTLEGLPSSPGDPLRLPVGSEGGRGPVVVLDAARLTNGQHYFACYEIEVEREDGKPGPLHFVLRTAVDGTDIRRQTGDPLPAEPPEGGDLYGHARGAWPYCSIQVAMKAPYLCGADPARLCLAQRLNPLEGTPDVELFRAATSLGEQGAAKANKGMYGVDYDPVEVWAHNPLEEDHVVHLLLGTLNPGKTASGMVLGLVGAVDVGKGAQGFPEEGQGFLYHPDQGVVHLLDLAVPAGESVRSSFRLQIGGASTLPCYVIMCEG